MKRVEFFSGTIAGFAVGAGFVLEGMAVFAQPQGTNAGPNVFPNIITTPTTVNALPVCSGQTNKGMRAFVLDQATVVAYQGAVTGGGGTAQPVVCNGTAWLQD